MKNNEKVHVEVIYWNNGNKYRETYVEENGIPIGVSRYWHKNGKMRLQEYFQNGELHGEVLIWTEDGTKVEEVRYLRGIIVFHKDFRVT